jgi:hypothetical protein
MELPDPAVGLCSTCRHCRIVKSVRAAFYLCERSFVDSRYRKYPPLPVTRCEGHEPRSEDDTDGPDEPRF